MKRGLECDFNTSHVTVYPDCCHKQAFVVVISIHPMLLFIALAIQNACWPHEFQYIPCYCLSGSLFFKISCNLLFQYIPCYCLSCLTIKCFVNSRPFQYIPCYCLSNCRWYDQLPIHISIHPMLLFILRAVRKEHRWNSFQYIPCYCLSKMSVDEELVREDFNTSHVTVYLFCFLSVSWF